MGTALSDLTSSLARVRDIADENDRNIATILSDAGARNRYETIRCASTVILSGFFESFLKQAADESIASLCALNRPFSSLPDKIKCSHYEIGGQILSRRAQDDRSKRASRIQATTENIALRLASVASTPYDLLWEAFAETYANPNSETVSQYLKRFGITKPWEKVASRTGTSAGALQTQLDSFLLVRHECAHTGTARSVPTPSEIREYCDLLERIANAILEVLDDHVSSL